MLDKYKGCLFGLAIGDALGSPFEFWLDKKVIKYLENNKLDLIDFERGEQKYPAGFYTDDTSMALCLAESLIEKGFDIENQFKKYRKWFLEGYLTPLGSCYGIGQQTMTSLRNEMKNATCFDGSDEDAGGNGSLMRCAPVGLYYSKDLDKIKEKSLLSSYVTHNNLIAGWSCVVLNSIIFFILKGKKKEEILKLILDYFSDEVPNGIYDCLRIDYSSVSEEYCYPISGYSLDTLKIAIWSWQTSENFETSIKKVIMLGNDTDTFASVTGAITGCYFGYNNIPEKWRNKIMDKDLIGKISEDLFNKVIE